jgi:hypothetical protein
LKYFLLAKGTNSIDYENPWEEIGKIVHDWT